MEEGWIGNGEYMERKWRGDGENGEEELWRGDKEEVKRGWTEGGEGDGQVIEERRSEGKEKEAFDNRIQVLMLWRLSLPLTSRLMLPHQCRVLHNSPGVLRPA